MRGTYALGFKQSRNQLQKIANVAFRNLSKKTAVTKRYLIIKIETIDIDQE